MLSLCMHDEVGVGPEPRRGSCMSARSITLFARGIHQYNWVTLQIDLDLTAVLKPEWQRKHPHESHVHMMMKYLFNFLMSRRKNYKEVPVTRQMRLAALPQNKPLRQVLTQRGLFIHLGLRNTGS